MHKSPKTYINVQQLGKSCIYIYKGIYKFYSIFQFDVVHMLLYIYTCGAVHTHWREVNPSPNGLGISSNIVSCFIQNGQFKGQPSAHTVVRLIQDGHFQPQHTMWTVLFRTDCQQSGLNNILITQLLLASPRKSSYV